MAAVTICSDFGAPQNSLTLFPLFLHLFPMKWWDQMPWSSFSECWALSQLFHSPLSLSWRGFLVPHGAPISSSVKWNHKTHFIHLIISPINIYQGPFLHLSGRMLLLSCQGEKLPWLPVLWKNLRCVDFWPISVISYPWIIHCLLGSCNFL